MIPKKGSRKLTALAVSALMILGLGAFCFSGSDFFSRSPSVVPEVSAFDRATDETQALPKPNPVAPEVPVSSETAVTPRIDPVLEIILHENDRQFLTEYGKIHSKVFRSSEDEFRRVEILRDVNLIQKVGQALRNPTDIKNSYFAETENAMIDFLLDCLKDGDSEVAQIAIREIIKDSQVENPSLEASVRETLAGVKAELLYQASGLNLESLLPGPVSQKIWKNVQERQVENLNESLKEKKSFESQTQN